MAKAPEYSLIKLAPPGSNPLAYPNHDRANDLYSMWMTGYTEDEIAEFISLDVSEVKKDLMYVNTKLTARQIIAHNNDRNRILLQRKDSESFRKMMSDSLSAPVEALLAAGLSPASILKEFREATGMVQKAEPLLQINTQINNSPAPSGGLTSAEDIIRRVLGQINQGSSSTRSEPESNDPGEPIDAEVVEQDPEDQIPDDD